MALVHTSFDNHIGVITLNDPRTRNSLSAALIEDLIAAFEEFRGRQARAVILRAAPATKTWSAGHNVRELPVNGRDPLSYNDPLRLAVRTIQRYPAPVLAMVEGGVWGGACEIVMACDLVIAAESATFALTPAKLGVPYNIAGTLNMIHSVALPVVKEMLFRARPVNAQRAHEVGLVNYVVPAEQLEAQTLEIAQDIITNSPLVISLMKEEIHVLTEAYPLSPNTFERIQGMRRRIYDSEDYQEGIRSFFEKRKPVFTGR